MSSKKETNVFTYGASSIIVGNGRIYAEESSIVKLFKAIKGKKKKVEKAKTVNNAFEDFVTA